MNDKQIIGNLRENIKVVVKDRVTREGLIYVNLPEIHSKQVCRNKKITGRELWIDA